MSSGHVGFLVPKLVARFNERQREQAFEDWLDKHYPNPWHEREGIDVDMWRLLPDSPSATT